MMTFFISGHQQARTPLLRTGDRQVKNYPQLPAGGNTNSHHNRLWWLH